MLSYAELEVALSAEGKLAGLVAVVTGAASGIGAGVATAFAREGARVALVDYADRSVAETVWRSVTDYGEEPTYHQTDVADADQVQAMARDVLAHYGRVDILVNNAGIFTEHKIESMPIEDWDRVLGVNLRGTFLC